MKLSRGFALVCGLAAFALGTAVAPAAFADSPLHEKDEFSDVESLPAGTVCDFDYVQTFTVRFNTIIFGDPADPSRLIDHVGFTITHTNADTGFALTEKGIVTVQISAEDARERTSACPGTCGTRTESWSCTRPGSCSSTPTPARSSSSRQT